MASAMNRIASANVDQYLKGLPEEKRAALEAVRKSIREEVPEAEEVISYQIPTFKLKGALVAYAAFSKHCSLYTMSHALMVLLKKDLEPYYTSGVTIHFSPDKPLPAAIIKKIVRERIKETEAISASRKMKK